MLNASILYGTGCLEPTLTDVGYCTDDIVVGDAARLNLDALHVSELGGGPADCRNSARTGIVRCAGESSSSAASPGTRATLDIFVEVFGGPAAKVRGAAAACWSAAAGNSAASRGNSEDTELPDRGFSSPTSETDLPWSSMPMAAADWRS